MQSNVESCLSGESPDSNCQVTDLSQPSTSMSGAAPEEELYGKQSGEFECLKLVIKWRGKDYPINTLEAEDTVFDLQEALFSATGVKPERQKLAGLKINPSSDLETLKSVGLKSGAKIMLIGALEEDIERTNTIPKDVPPVRNDLFGDEGDGDESFESAAECPENLAKVEQRAVTLRVERFNPLRAEKKLLVLDIDYTIFDHRSVGQTMADLARPYLHEFLTSAYVDYDIVIWSATTIKWIRAKLRELGMLGPTNSYRIAFALDSAAMVSVRQAGTSASSSERKCKPLGVLWSRFSQFSPRNTIAVDDIRDNFAMNPRSGLRIRPFKRAFVNRATDRELLRLSFYLQMIAPLDDFTQLDHRNWKEYTVSRLTAAERRAFDGE